MITPGLRPPEPPARETGLAGRLRDIEAVTDAALSLLDEQALLDVLLERVKTVLDADTATVLLLDRPTGQLVATAATGIEEEVRQGVRIPLGAGFAGHVAATKKPVILNQVDLTTVRNPLLVDRGIRSLLGVPLLASGQVIGVLHVGSLTGRQFGQEDVELLQLAADRAALAVYAMMARDDRQAAVALHRSLLPSALPAMPGVELAARYITGSGNVGGDWYDVFVLPSGKLGIVVGDVAGSGLAAAVTMGRMRGVRWPELARIDSGDGCGTLDVTCPDGGKTKYSRRRIVLDPGTMDLLEAWRSETAGSGGRGYVFANGHDGERAWNPAWVSRRVIRASAQTGVSVSVTGLRHYSMFRMTVLGVPADVMALRLGLDVPASRTFRSAESILAADREAALMLADELDQAVAGASTALDG
jgi:putative methionine-R-sulfoxide reductase with GAF domain